MSRIAVQVAALLVGSVGLAAAARTVGRHGHGFRQLRADLQPEVVARSLVRVEDEWRTQVAALSGCNTTETPGCAGMPKPFGKSCSTVVGAVLQASSGERGVVQEYLDEVCGQGSLVGWRGATCQSFAAEVVGGMSHDAYSNREHLDAAPLCQRFWVRFVEDERVQVQKDLEERAAEEKRRQEKQEEEAKQAAAALAEEKKRQASEEAARRSAEEQQAAKAREMEARRAAAAKRAAEEAERASIEAAARMADAAAGKVAAAAEDQAAEASREVAETQATLAEAEHLEKGAEANATAPVVAPTAEVAVQAAAVDLLSNASSAALRGANLSSRAA